jgi:Glycosyl hydrolase catalytic core
VSRNVLALICFIGCAASPAFAQNAHYGMNAHDVSAMTADKMTELGAGIVRVVYGWDVIEPNCKGCFNWSFTDAWRDEARRTKRAIFGTLGYTPRWANGGAPFNTSPLNDQDWYDFVYATVNRYQDDVFFWGIWNEPNLDSYLRNRDLQAYERLARTAESAIHAANPSALVLGPDVSHHAIESGWYAAAMRAFGSLFDIVTVHWYVDGPPLEGFMDEGVRPWAMRKDVWLTEVGMTPCQTNLGEAGQALFYQRVLRAFERRRGWWTGVLFYDLHDLPNPLNCGAAITRPDWSNRPAFSLYQAFMKAYP